MQADFSNKTVLVTGGSSGIGVVNMTRAALPSLKAAEGLRS